MSTKQFIPTFTTDENTRIYNHISNGWTGSTKVNINGKNWVITTLKRHTGVISTHCHTVKDEGNGAFSYAIFGHDNNESFYLNVLPKGTRATEKTIKEAHYKSLCLFDAKREANELPNNKEEYQIKIGQVFFTDGPGYDRLRRAVCEILPGDKYKTVLLDGSNIKHDSHVRPYSKKFGIGTYFNEGDVISEEQVNDLLITAHLNIKEREQKEAIKAAENVKISNEYKERGAALFAEHMPTGAVGVIIARYQIDESDAQTDYFGSKTSKTIILSFTTKQKEDFKELRAACLNCDIPEIKELANATEDMEHREKYTGGHGYYLGEWYTRTGWKIQKETYTRLEHWHQTAGAEGCFYAFKKEAENKATAQTETVSNTGNIEILDYSDRAVAVFGETKPVKDLLKQLGGRFNPGLTHPQTGQRVAGWVFSIKNKEAIIKELQTKGY